MASQNAKQSFKAPSRTTFTAPLVSDDNPHPGKKTKTLKKTTDIAENKENKPEAALTRTSITATELGEENAVGEREAGEKPRKKKKQREKKAKAANAKVKELTNEEYENLFSAVLLNQLIPLDDDQNPLADETTRDTDDVLHQEDFDSILDHEHQDDEIVGDEAQNIDDHHDLDEDGNLNNMQEHIPEEIQAHLSQCCNETTPHGSDAGVRLAVAETVAPPKLLGKNTKKGKKPKTPKNLNFPANKHIAKPALQMDADSAVTETRSETSKVKCQKVGKTSKKEKMKERVIEETGTWVQCSSTSCLKWRYLSEMHDPAQLPEVWTCDMNTDLLFDSCDKPEQSWNEEEHSQDFIYTRYTEGSIVWAKMAGYPWWPAMVEIDPDYETYFECRGFANVASHYHVIFFDERVSRSWLAAASLRPFTGHAKEKHVGPSKIRGVDHKKSVAVAKQRALSALDLPITERLKQFSFCERYTGKWAKGCAQGSQSSLSSPEVKSKRAAAKKRGMKRKRTEDDDVNFADFSLDHAEMEELLDSAEALISEGEGMMEFLCSQSTEEEMQGKTKKRCKNKSRAAQKGTTEASAQRKDSGKSSKKSRKVEKSLANRCPSTEQTEKSKPMSKPKFSSPPVMPACKSTEQPARALSPEEASNTTTPQTLQRECFPSDIYTMELDPQQSQEQNSQQQRKGCIVGAIKLKEEPSPTKYHTSGDDAGPKTLVKQEAVEPEQSETRSFSSDGEPTTTIAKGCQKAAIDTSKAKGKRNRKQGKETKKRLQPELENNDAKAATEKIKDPVTTNSSIEEPKDIRNAAENPGIPERKTHAKKDRTGKKKKIAGKSPEEVNSVEPDLQGEIDVRRPDTDENLPSPCRSLRSSQRSICSASPQMSKTHRAKKFTAPKTAPQMVDGKKPAKLKKAVVDGSEKDAEVRDDLTLGLERCKSRDELKETATPHSQASCEDEDSLSFELDASPPSEAPGKDGKLSSSQKSARKEAAAAVRDDADEDSEPMDFEE